MMSKERKPADLRTTLGDQAAPRGPSETSVAARLRWLWHRIARGWSKIWSLLVRVPVLCAYGTLAAFLVVFFFVFNEQGQDLLRISSEPGYWFWNLSLFGGTAILSLALWYTTRLLLGSELPGYPLDLSQALTFKTWLPRVLGALAPLSIAVGYAIVGSDDPHPAVFALSALYFLLTAALVWFFIARRRLLNIPREALIEHQALALGSTNTHLMWSAGLLSFVLLGAFLVWPVVLPQAIGAPAIIVLGLAGIVLFGSMVLTYAFLIYGLPAGTPLALAAAVLFAYINDNHWVRVAEDAASPAMVAASRARPSPDERYLEWRTAHGLADPAGERRPLILVAAAGGGIRAAYWTASTLATLDAIPGFSKNLFAISGVSGGSLGAAAYTAFKRQQLETGTTEETVLTATKMLGEDFLSPVVAGLLFPDLMQRFLPTPIAAADRQRFLETSWEKSFKVASGSERSRFSEAFLALYDGALGARLPSLLLNATVVDSGRRAIVSNMRTDSFTDTLDLLSDGFSTQGVRLSAAAGMSARFTYVSPPGSLRRPEGGTRQASRPIKIQVVDGGYFENSGAATLMDLLSTLDQRKFDVLPILILIRNDPQAPAVCQRKWSAPPETPSHGATLARSGHLLSEVAAPIRALLNTRSARGRLAEVDAARKVERLGGAVIEISLAALLQREPETEAGTEAGRLPMERLEKQIIEPPLGWSLSEMIRKDMDQALIKGYGGLNEELGILATLLSSGTLNPAQNACNAR